MDKRILMALVACMFLFSMLPGIYAEKPLDDNVNYAPDEIVVKFKQGLPEQNINSIAAAHGLSVISQSQYTGVHRMKIPTGKTVIDIASKLNKNPHIEYAEPNYIYTASMSPNDPYYSYQWHLHDLSQGGINMEAAWDISTGSGTVVAIIDTGISQAGNDLEGNFVAGYDFVNGDTDPTDDNGHGTHCAGTVAQSTNNGVGVCGVAFGASLMPVKVLDRLGSGSLYDVADGIIWATDHGANIISMSLGASSGASTLENAVAYAYNNGVTVIAASGNDGHNGVSYPAAYDAYVIAVGATRYDKTRATYSNYGSSLDVVAPGGDLNVDQNGDGYGDGVLQETFSGTSWGYYFFDGTSMATPHVAGVAALLYSHGVTSPDAIRNTLQSTAVDLGSSGWDMYYGHGLINAYNALTYNSNSPPTCTLAADPTSGETPLTTTFTMGASDSDGTIASWELDVDNDGNAEYSGTGLPPTTQSHCYDTIGIYTAELTVWDDAGDTGTDTEIITATAPNTKPGEPSNLVVQHYGVSSVEDFANAEIINQGNTNTDYTYTYIQDDIHHEITEIYVGGPSNRGKYSLDIIFPISITGGSGPYTLMLDAYRLDSESYSISYQVNNGGYSTLGQISAGSDTDSYLSWQLSNVIAGDTIDIRIVDTQEGIGETIGTLYVDHLYIQSSGSGGATDHNKLTWDASAHDGAGADDVTSYNVYKSSDGSSWGSIDSVIADNSATYSYVDSGAGTADGTQWWYKVTAIDGGGLESIDSNVVQEPGTTNNPPIADFTYTKTDLAVDFIDASYDSDGSIVSWSWNFGDGATSTAQNPSHTYATDGTYTVTLTVTDDDGATGTTSQDVTVSSGTTNNPPTASFIYSTSELTATFTDKSTDSDGYIASWSWNFGDGATSTAQNPSHTYATDGTYTVTLTVTDDDGATGTTSQDVTVSSGSGGGITLTATGYKVRGRQMVDLEWTGATSSVNIYRDGSIIASGVSGSTYTDNIGAVGGGSYIYKVCDTSTCSNEVTVTFA